MSTPFASKLKEVRTGRDDTLKTLSEKMDISVALLSAIELGNRNPTPGFIAALSLAYKDGLSHAAWSRLAEASADAVDVSSLDYEDRQMVAAFARKLGGGVSDTHKKAIADMVEQFGLFD
ncbi:MAG: helix-turn-helix transcriptional regulator [Pseudomonadota bacterium]